MEIKGRAYGSAIELSTMTVMGDKPEVLTRLRACTKCGAASLTLSEDSACDLRDWLIDTYGPKPPAIGSWIEHSGHSVCYPNLTYEKDEEGITDTSPKEEEEK